MGEDMTNLIDLLADDGSACLAAPATYVGVPFDARRGRLVQQLASAGLGGADAGPASRRDERLRRGYVDDGGAGLVRFG
jgi:hypothetical protein